MVKQNLTPERIEKNLEDVRQIVASFHLEGIEPPSGAVNLLERQARGEISADEAVEIAKKGVLGEQHE